MKFLPIGLLMGFFGLFSFKTAVKPARVVFFGDSITEAAVHPGGYIAQMQTLLAGQNRADSFELIGSGIGGNKVYDLYLRLKTDVLERKPDVVFIYVGVNDVWHKRTSGTGTDADKFRQFYAALIRKIQAGGSRVILCTPACIGEKVDCTDALDGDLNHYADIIRSLSRQFQTGLCDLRQDFANYWAEHNSTNLESGVLTTDGVHLNALGNQLVAETMLAELGK